MPPRTDISEKKFGRLTVLKYVSKNLTGQYRLLCICDCGNKITVQYCNLISGNTKSCGCLQKEKSTQHGHSKKGQISKIYQSWTNMITRCTNPKNKSYSRYGGRGIKVCQRWRKFENFLEDMGEMPEGHQIDRINNNLGYCPENCRWATRTEQMRNTKRNHLITFRGKTQCLSAWAEKFNIKVQTLESRINKLGWSIEKSLTTPVGK
jgi:hypothetical protein